MSLHCKAHVLLSIYGIDGTQGTKFTLVTCQMRVHFCKLSIHQLCFDIDRFFLLGFSLQQLK